MEVRLHYFRGHDRTMARAVVISKTFHFPTCSSDWDLELAFLVFTNFGTFIQYLAECKVTNTGTSQHCTAGNLPTFLRNSNSSDHGIGSKKSSIAQKV